MHHNRLQFASEINQITSKAVLHIIITIIMDIICVIRLSRLIKWSIAYIFRPVNT